MKQAQNQPKFLQTSPKFAIKLAVCSESNHHILIVFAIFVQHATDLSCKATSKIQNENN